MSPSPLDPYRTAEHGLASLVVAAREILAAAGRAAGDERVSSFPDARTLRYYQSLGVLDRPLRHDGREVVYGYRHLLQAVVTKLLQAEGYSLAQVQRTLLGRTTEALEQAVTEALDGCAAPRDPSVAPPSSATPRPPPTPTPLPTPASAPAAADRRALITREVAPGVLVTLDPRLVPDPDSVLDRIAHALTHATGGSR